MADTNAAIESQSSSLIKSAGSLISMFKDQLYSIYRLGSMTIPFSSLGLGLANRTINFYVPKAILWFAGLSSSLHFLRQVKCMNIQFMNWMRSFFNAPKYLNPIADKIQNFKKEKLKEPD